MTHVFAKLRMRGNSNKYRKMLSTEEEVYRTPQQIVIESFPYNPGSGAWETVDYDSLKKDDYENIDFLFTQTNESLYFQRFTKAKLVRKKHIWEFGGEFKYVPDTGVLALNDYPDAIYVPQEDVLYFQRFETASLIFKSMVRLYRDATDHEVKSFLGNSFIVTVDGFEANNVTRSNRKLIAQAVDQFEDMKQEDKKKIFSYIQEYCPYLATEGKQFIIKSNKDSVFINNIDINDIEGNNSFRYDWL